MLGYLLLVPDRLIPLLWPCDHVLVLVARCRFEIYLASPSWTFAVLFLLKRIIVRLQEDSICVDRLRYDLIAPQSSCRIERRTGDVVVDLLWTLVHSYL